MVVLRFGDRRADGRDAFSLIASAVRNGLEPYQYLSCLLTELPLLGDKPTREQLLPYMPNVWRPYNGDSSL